MSTATYGRFVKSQGTAVPVGRSQAELQKLLRRYGATGFGVASEYEAGVIRVFFRVPDEATSADLVPVRLEVNVGAVYEAIYNRPAPAPRLRGKFWEQAERVAWRHIVLWVDAALSAASAGVQRISEAFLAHTLVAGRDGIVRRVVDHLDAVSGGSWKAMLPPPGGEG